MSVRTVFMPNMHKRFHCISLRVNSWFLAFGLFEGNAKHLPRMWRTVSLRRLELSVQGCLTNMVVQDGDPCEQALQDAHRRVKEALHEQENQTAFILQRLYTYTNTFTGIILWGYKFYTQYLWHATSLHLQYLSQPAVSSSFDVSICR